MVRRRVSRLGCLHRPWRRGRLVSERRRRQRPTSGRVFNRAAVETALRRAIALWSRLNRAEYPHGVIVFCSEGVAQAVHPIRPLHRRVYSCGRHFDTGVLREQLRAERAPAYGIIVVDGSDACIGTAQGLGSSSSCAVTKLASLSSGTRSQTRRGGQSALRYSRLREENDLAFLRRVAERAGRLLGDARGIVLAGKADAKHRLRPELPQLLRDRVLCSLDLPCDAGTDGLRMAAVRAGQTVETHESREAQGALSDFMELLQKPQGDAGALVCYGKPQTNAALEMGAVETLLVAACGSIEQKRWFDLASSSGTVVVEVQNFSTHGALFCNNFQLGGILRWPVDPDLLDVDDTSNNVDIACAEDDADASLVPAQTSRPRSGACSSSSTEADYYTSACQSLEEHVENESCQESSRCSAAIDRDACGELFKWLEQALTSSLGDQSQAEALVACTEVILGEGPIEWDVLDQAKEMLLGEGVPQEVVDAFGVRALSM